MATDRDEHVEGARTRCECFHTGCVETITLSRDEYELVRRVPTHFLIVPGHEKPEIERVVERTHRYVVVEKFGEAGEAAVRLDRRPKTAGLSS